MKNIVVICGSYPDVGKGILTASLAYLLQIHGLKVAPLKFDGYINFSSGSMNPYHAKVSAQYSEEEVFVLKDGYEQMRTAGTTSDFYNKHLQLRAT